MSRTLSGLFLVGASNRLRKNPRRNRENPRQIGKVPRGRKFSPKFFSDRSLFEPPWGHGRLRLRVMDVRTEMLASPGFQGLDRSFCARTSAGISAMTSAGCPAPKLTLWATFSFLSPRKDKKGQIGTDKSRSGNSPIF